MQKASFVLIFIFAIMKSSVSYNVYAQQGWIGLTPNYGEQFWYTTSESEAPFKNLALETVEATSAAAFNQEAGPQQAASQEASSNDKENLAQDAEQIIDTARATLAGKQFAYSVLESQVKELQVGLEEEVKQYESAGKSAKAAGQAADAAEKQVESLTKALENAKAAAEQVRTVVQEAETEWKSQSSMVKEAQESYRSLSDKLREAQVDYEATKEAAEKASAAAEEAKENAARAKSSSSRKPLESRWRSGDLYNDRY